MKSTFFSALRTDDGEDNHDIYQEMLDEILSTDTETETEY